MDFRFDETERSMLAEARAAIRRSFDLSRFRQSGPTLGAWKTLAEAGWLHAGLDSSHGGAGFSLAIQAGIAREAGRVLLVEEWVDNAFLIPSLLTRAHAAERIPALLARHCDVAGFVVSGGQSEGWLGPASAESTSWCFGVVPDGDAYWVELHGDGTTLVRLSNAAIARAADPGITLGAGRVTVAGGTEERIPLDLSSTRFAELHHGARTLHSSALVGVAEEALQLTVEYAKVRVQYGSPIGQFQALKHMLADVRVANEIGGNSVYYAALRGLYDPSAVSAARLKAVDAALGATKTMMQIFGGIGFTWECDVHLFLKTALNGAIRFGSTDAEALALGEQLLAQALALGEHVLEVA